VEGVSTIFLRPGHLLNSLNLLFFQQKTSVSDTGTHDNMDTPTAMSVASDIVKTALTELKCPACKQFMAPPITFCLGGHNICNSCRPTVSSCPTCNQGFLKTRNVALENLSLQMKFPCPCSEFGCKEFLSYSAIREHVAKCDYSPQNCPVDDLKLKTICTWTGINKNFKRHLQTVHKELCADYNSQHLLLLPSSNASNYNKFLFAYNEIFCYRLLNHRGIMHVVLHYIGPAENDLKYQYKVMVMNNEDTEGVEVTRLARRFTKTEDDEIFPKNCLKFHHALTERFRNENGELLILLKIIRVDN
jgi:hypothetical protein